MLSLLHKYMPVKVMVLKNVPLIPLLGSAYQRGSEASIPYFVAEALEAEGYVEVLDKFYSAQELSKYRFIHSQQKGKLVKLEDFFYIKAVESIKAVEARARREGDITLIRALDRMRDDFNEIFNARFATILRAVQFRGAEVLAKDLSVEEKLLLKLLSDIVSRWMERYTKA